MTTEEQQAPDGTTPQMEPPAALEWLDTAIAEFKGSVDECSRHIAAGSLPTLEVSARLNTFMLWLMEVAQQGQQAVARGEVEVTPEGDVKVPAAAELAPAAE
jgi:hypothetical protein